MNKKLFVILIIGLLLFGVSVAMAAIDNQTGDGSEFPGPGTCVDGDTVFCTTNGLAGEKTCVDGRYGACVANTCNISLSMPASVTEGQTYNVSWNSNNVSGTLTGYCSDTNYAPMPGLPASYSFQAQGTVSKTCYMKGASPSGSTCTSNSVTQTVIQPSCSASISWSPNPTVNGTSKVSWKVSGSSFDPVVKLVCGSVDYGEVNPSDSRDFRGLSSNKSCAVTGYKYNFRTETLTQKCSSSQTLIVNAPACTSGQTQACTLNGESGLQTCVNGSFGNCVICNNGQTRSCAPAGGGTGLQTCSANSWGSCVPGPICSTGQVQACTVNGQAGTQTCSVNGNWGSCVTTPPGSVEISVSPAAAIGWEVSGPANYSGSGSKTLSNTPSGSYSLSVTSWAGRVVTGILKSVTGNSTAFLISNRQPQTNKGTLAVSPQSIYPGNNINVSAATNDPADGNKSVTLSKALVRSSNGGKKTLTARNWARTDSSGNFVKDVQFNCDGADGGFTDGDYVDSGNVTYDQGDGTGDSSPAYSVNKLCGTSVNFDSQEATSSGVGKPIPISWSLSGPYSTWDSSQSRVTKPSSAAYGMRVDEGAYTLSVTPPTGYTLYRIAGRARHAIASGYVPVCDSFPCNFAADRNHAYSFSIIWALESSTQTINCTPSSQTVQAGQLATLSGSGSFSGYSWSAPEGNPSSGSGSSFTTTYSSIGQKVVTVTSGSSNKSCLVDVIAGNTPSPAVDLKVNGSDGTIQLQQNQSATLRWIDREVDSCVASGAWTGSKSISGGFETKTFANIGLYTFTITCRNLALSRNVSDTVRVNVSNDINPLQVTLTPNPASGEASLPVDLTAVVSGETGSINYNFWWNCNSAAATFAQTVADCGNPANPAVGAKLDAQTPETKTVNQVYTFPGAYIAKVVAERGQSSAENRATVSVTGQPPFHLECVSSTCAKVSGPGANTCASQGISCGAPTHYECVANSCARVNGAGGDKDGCSSANTGTSCVPGGGGGQSHYGCVSNTCIKINSPGSDTDGCNSGNVGATCTPGGNNPPPGTCTFTASPSLVNQGGSSVLSWKDCGNVCSISGVGGGFSGTGSARVSPSVNTTYTLSCDNGASVKTAKVSIFGLQEEVPQ